MNVPTNCPVCNAPLQDFRDDTLQESETCKRCATEDHHVSFLSRDDKITQICISYDIQNNLDAVWFTDAASSTLVIAKTKTASTQRSGFSYQRLPYFEPDLSNYPKLLDKIKTYLLFS